MFYFDEDHMENGFEAPEASDHEEEHSVTKEVLQRAPSEREQRSSGSGRPTRGNLWSRSGNSGSTFTSSKGSYNHMRYSPDLSSRRSSSGRSGHSDLGRDAEQLHTVSCEFEDLDCQSESEEQPAELVPLGLRSLAMSGCKSRHRRKKMRSNFSDFYKLTDEHLGSGAYASVRTGVSISTGKEFAIKLVDKHEEGHTRSRIMREVETFNMCKNHPNIVQLHEWFEDDDYFYMVFEKMRGGPLLNHIQRKGFFTEQEASKVTRDISSALKYLHDHGIAHRDVKPENVLCFDKDHVSPVKLCDLDLASKAAVASPPRMSSVNSEPDLASPVGSAEFMAPEVVDAFVGDALKYDKRCDMWSLGVIVYIMICGYPPFYGQCWRENCGWDQGLSCSDCQENLFKRIQRGEFDFPEPEWDTVSDEAKDLIRHLLVKNVRDRFTADDVLKHPWITNGAPKTKLQTPGNLIRNDSARDFHQMQENFNVMNRMVAARLSARIEQKSEPKNQDEQSAVKPAIKSSVENVPADIQPIKRNDNGQETNALMNKLAVNNNMECVECTISPPIIHRAKPPKECSLVTPVPVGPVMTGQSSGILLTPASQLVLQPAAVSQFQRMDAPPPRMHIAQLPQMIVASPMGYGSPMALGPQQPIVPPIPFHPNQVVNMNGLIAYPNPVFAEPFYYPELGIQQQMFKFGMQPQQFMAPPCPTMFQQYGMGHQRRSSIKQIQSSNPFNKAGGASKNGLLSVQSATTLSATGKQQIELETCQTAMARQDSKSDVRPQTRETQVNV